HDPTRRPGRQLKRPKVVLLHSALGDSRLWRRQVDALTPRFDVVTPDLPGFGQTPEPKEPFSFVDRVVPHLPAALVGNSMGGRVALNTALAFPDRVTKLVLVGAGVGAWDWTETMRDYFAAEEEAWAAGDRERAIQITSTSGSRPPSTTRCGRSSSGRSSCSRSTTSRRCCGPKEARCRRSRCR